MTENSSSPKPRAEWPSTFTPYRVRKKREREREREKERQRERERESRRSYQQAASYFQRSVAVPSTSTSASTSASPPRNTLSRPSVQIHQQSLPAQSTNSKIPNLWDFRIASIENQTFDQTVPHHGPPEFSWQGPMVSYPYPSIPPNSPPSPLSLHGNTPSPHVGQRQMSTHHEVAFSWDTPIRNGRDYNPDVDVGSFSDSDYEKKFGSFDSMGVSNPSTIASSISENYVLPSSNPELNSPVSGDQLQDLSLSDGYFQAMQAFDPPSNVGNSISPTSPGIQDPFQFEHDFPSMQDWIAVGDMSVYNNEMAHWSSATITQPQGMQDFQFGQSSTSSQIPWNTHVNALDIDPDTGCVAFEPSHGSGYGAYLAGQEFLDTRQRDVTPPAVSPTVSPTGDDSDHEGWQHVTFSPYAISSIPSQGSPPSASESPFEVINTPHQSPSPRPHHNDHSDHQHVFTLYPGIAKPPQKLPRGRQRALTTKEKKEAREVREAKACWACHLSKIKCSPCSPGSPCRKCAELIGKRRFCLLPCFNDPLESLYTFMVPDYLMGHFTKANVERFVSDNATGWGRHEMVIRMTWGYWKPLEATVVSLEIHGNSQIGVHHQTSANGTSRPTLVRKSSPPLGIPLAAMDDMQEEYRVLLQNIVHDDLINYVSIAYDDQESELPERLLKSLGTFYCASKVAGSECDLLRQALEIHVTCTILERSLILDDESQYTVENYLNVKFPPRSAARCVQRQVKLAFFEVQRKRIIKVLEAWGSLMWTSNKSTSSDKKWAVSFSVFLALVLAIDKTLGQGYFFCETRIAYHGAEASSERRQFQELVRLTQAELFERCKEIFHCSFKTRKNGKEACNPIRDGIGAFKGRDVDKPIERFVDDLRAIAREFRHEVKSHRSSTPDPSGEDEPYLDAGRLAAIFLDDFLDH